MLLLLLLLTLMQQVLLLLLLLCRGCLKLHLLLHIEITCIWLALLVYASL